MLRSYLTIALRNARRDGVFSLLNVIGLAIGLACGILILLYVQREFSYDRHHAKADRIHRVFTKWTQANGETSYGYAAQGPVGPTLVEDYPEVEDGTRFMRREVSISFDNQEGIHSEVMVADDRFFHVFDFPAVIGDPTTDLIAPGSVFVTRRMARQLFGDASPIGRRVLLTAKFFNEECTITGVLEDPPTTSILDLAPDVVTLTRPRKSADLIDEMWEKWQHGFITTQTYIVLRPGASPDALRGKFRDFVVRHYGEWAEWTNLETMPLTELHLQGRQRYSLSFLEGDITTSYTLAIIGILITAVACINYMNLATARSARRVREVGMRKVSGARRGQLILQFMGESVLIVTISTISALGIVALALPSANGFMNMDLSIDAGAVPALIVFALVVGGLAGIYPALFLSSFPPASAFRADRGGRSGHGGIRKGLVACQFAVSMSLIVATQVIVRQSEYMRTSDPGYETEALIFVEDTLPDDGQIMKDRLIRVPGVLGVSILHVPFTQRNWTSGDVLSVVAGADTIRAPYILADEDFLNVFKIPLVDGRHFTDGDIMASTMSNETWEEDQAKLRSVMVNQTGAKTLGVRLGDTIGFWGVRVPVVGIVADFHYDSLREPIGAVVIIPAMNVRQLSFNLRIATTVVPSVIEGLETAWESVAPTASINLQFMDDELGAAYAKERLMGELSSLCATLAIVIACLGLLALIAYTAETRTREVGIRKVLGASEVGLVGMLTREFIVLVSIAGVIATPVAWLVMDMWLQGFAYRIEIGPVPFVIAVAGALALTLATISWQAMRAARANPVDALRIQ
jgi:putative ABC transport system permease protein